MLRILSQLSQLSRKNILFSVFLIVFLVNIAYAFTYKIKPVVDARTYYSIGTTLADGYGYRTLPETPTRMDVAINYVGPGYPLFLAGIFKVFGNHLEIVWLIQSLIAGLSAVLVCGIYSKLLETPLYRNAQLLAVGLVTGLNPDFITTNSMTLTENLSVFLMIVLIFVTTSLLTLKSHATSRLHSVGVGLAIATMVLVRMTALFLVPITLFILWKRGGYKQTLIAVATAVLLFSPWVIRNYEVYQHFIPTTAALGNNLLAGNNPEADGEYHGLPPQYAALDEITDPIEKDSVKTKTAVTYILHHPFQYIALSVRRFSITLSPIRPSAFWFHLTNREQQATAGVSIIYTFLLFIFAAFGGLLVWNNSTIKRETKYYLLAILLALFVPVVAIIIETRYRFGLYPIFALLATYGLFHFGKERLRQFMYATSFILLNTGIDIARNLGNILQKF